MPTTINGIGTHYYGKRNLEKEPGQCEFCQNFVELETYETGLYFVVLYIPIIPLGRKQILNYCPSCSRHRVMSVRQWTELKENAIEASTENLAQKMDDPEAAVEHLNTLTAFRNWEDARQFAPALEKTHGDNIDVLLYLGSWHESYGQPEDANRCFDAAYKLDPENPGAKRARAVGLLEQGQLDQAAEMLESFLPPSPDYDPLLFFVLGKHYQEANRHEEALKVFDRIAAETPELATEDEMRKAVRISEKITGLKSEFVKQKPWYQNGWIIAGILGAIVVGVILYNAIT